MSEGGGGGAVGQVTGALNSVVSWADAAVGNGSALGLMGGIAGMFFNIGGGGKAGEIFSDAFSDMEGEVANEGQATLLYESADGFQEFVQDAVEMPEDFDEGAVFDYVDNSDAEDAIGEILELGAEDVGVAVEDILAAKEDAEAAMGEAAEDGGMLEAIIGFFF